jgi:hypothetical protein
VIFAGDLPVDVPGFARLDERRALLARLTAGLEWLDLGGGDKEARVGPGRILAGGGFEALLARAGVGREPMVDRGLQFARRRDASFVTYFIANRSDAAVDGWVPISPPEKRPGLISLADGGAVLFDPMQARRGSLPMRRGAAGGHEVYLQLAAGESCVLRVTLGPAGGAARAGGPAESSASRASTEPPVLARGALEAFPLYKAAGQSLELVRGWRVEFVSGGPELPAPADGVALRSWTELGGAQGRAFSGTARYTIRVSRPAQAAAAWRLHLGRVHETARVRLNGRELGTLIGPDYSLTIQAAQLALDNRLEIEVSNLMANRIADMDRRGLPWKIFYNVNMPASRPENRGADGLFDASRWEPRPSGLLGPVTLTPLAAVF